MSKTFGAQVIASVSIESYGQGASIFSVACGGAGWLAKEQLDATRVWDLGTSASTMCVANLQAAADCLKIVLPMSLLLFSWSWQSIILEWMCYWECTTTRHLHSWPTGIECVDSSTWRADARTHSQGKVHITVKKLFMSKLKYVPTIKREFCNQELETLLFWT